MEEKCGNCRFAKQSRMTENFIFCRRLPPVMGVGSMIGSYVLPRPELHPDEWCGEWQVDPKNAEVKA